MAISEGAASIVDAEKEDVALYEKYKSLYSYGVYVAQKIGYLSMWATFF